MEVLHRTLTGFTKKTGSNKYSEVLRIFLLHHTQDRKDMLPKHKTILIGQHWSIEGPSEQTNINVQDATWPSSNQYTTLCET